MYGRLCIYFCSRAKNRKKIQLRTHCMLSYSTYIENESMLWIMWCDKNNIHIISTTQSRNDVQHITWVIDHKSWLSIMFSISRLKMNAYLCSSSVSAFFTENWFFSFISPFYIISFMSCNSLLHIVIIGILYCVSQHPNRNTYASHVKLQLHNLQANLSWPLFARYKLICSSRKQRTCNLM